MMLLTLSPIRTLDRERRGWACSTAANHAERTWTAAQ